MTATESPGRQEATGPARTWTLVSLTGNAHLWHPESGTLCGAPANPAAARPAPLTATRCSLCRLLSDAPALPSTHRQTPTGD